MPEEKLVELISLARKIRGREDTDIRQTLIDKGYNTADVDEAFAFLSTMDEIFPEQAPQTTRPPEPLEETKPQEKVTLFTPGIKKLLVVCLFLVIFTLTLVLVARSQPELFARFGSILRGIFTSGTPL